MSGFDPLPEEETVERERGRRKERQETFDRVYNVVLGLKEFSTVSEISELADCSENAAKKNLERLGEIGVVEIDRDSRPTRYRRNDDYLRWRRIDEVSQTNSLDELRRKLRDLEERNQRFKQNFDADSPGEVEIDPSTHDEAHTKWEKLTEWATLQENIRVLDEARREKQKTSVA